jgi:glucokinase
MTKAKSPKSPSKSQRSHGGPGTYTVGIDLGGTKVAAALVDHQGKIVSEARLPTVPPWMKELDPRATTGEPSQTDVRKHITYVVSAMADATTEVLAPLALKRSGKSIDKILGIGLASAGPMNLEKGTLDYPSNFKGWKIVPLVRSLQKALEKRGLKKPITFQNDAVAAALGEGWVGRAKECHTYAMITVGTGIGTGVVFNGSPAQSRGMGSEWGHLMVNAPGIQFDPSSYNDRSVEGLASGTGLIRRAKALGFRGESAADLAEAAKRGDPLALKVFAGASEALAALFYSLSLGFHPQKFVVSGGMLAIQEHFLPQAKDLYRELMIEKNPKFLTSIQVAKLGTKAGVIGAARLPRL